VTALADGLNDLPSVRAALSMLERERARIELELAALRQRGPSGPTNRDDVIKTIVQSLLQRVRIDLAERRAVLRWSHLLRPDSFVKLVAVGGIEPPTRGL
jgi:hypothetical protein